MTDDEAISLLEAMLRIPSVSGDEATIARYLVDALRRHGLNAEIDEAGNAIGVVGEGTRTAMLVGHMDTVPGNIWVRQEHGRLYGRGAVDAKGPLAAFIAAAARLAADRDLSIRIIVAGCVEEEVPSSKGAHFLLSRYRPDFCIVGEPSGWDGITLGYKGAQRATLRLQQAAGHSAHAGATAAEHAVQVWAAISSAADNFNQGRERLFDRLLPTLVGISSGGDGLYDWVQLEVNLRLPPGMSPASSGGWLRAQAPGCEVTELGGVAAWSGPRTTPLVRALSRAIRDQGGEPRYLLKTGTADLNLLAPAWGCPALAYGPGDAALDHTPDEHIVIEEFLRSIKVLEHTLRACGAAA